MWLVPIEAVYVRGSHDTRTFSLRRWQKQNIWTLNLKAIRRRTNRTLTHTHWFYVWRSFQNNNFIHNIKINRCIHDSNVTSDSVCGCFLKSTRSWSTSAWRCWWSRMHRSSSASDTSARCRATASSRRQPWWWRRSWRCWRVCSSFCCRRDVSEPDRTEVTEQV